MRFPKDVKDEEMVDMIDYLRKNPASVDYHFLSIRDAKWDGPIQFKYFNDNQYQSNKD